MALGRSRVGEGGSGGQLPGPAAEVASRLALGVRR